MHSSLYFVCWFWWDSFFYGPVFVCVGNPRAGAPPTGGDHAAVLPGGEDPSGVAQPGEQDAQVRGQRVERERASKVGAFYLFLQC